MKITDFEKKIQTDIDPDLSIRVNPNHDDIAGVYWNDLYLGVALPPVEIRQDISRDYTDKTGYPYKNMEMATDFIKGKLDKFKKAYEEDPALFKDDKK